MDAHADVPPSGAVLGIDVGYSRKAATTGLCLLLWDVRSVELSFLRTNSTTPERRRDVRALVAGAPLHAVAIDGPLTRGLQRVSRYRAAEALLSRGVLQKRGKPGQTSSPVGQQLHFHATELAELVLAEVTIDLACHYQPIHEQCVVEAFPNMFLAAGVAEVDLPLLHRDASDRYWAVLVAQSTRLSQLFTALLPGRAVKYDLCGCVDHDDRAALVCALSALSVVAKSHVGVGDACDGDIVLPPRSWWGPSLTGDSEQIIIASCNRRENGLPHITYHLGSLENITPEEHGIRQQVCRILEGGADAFRKRERRYALAERQA